MSQEEAADETGVDHVSICKYERGVREPRLQTLVRLADYYDVSVDWLLGRTDRKTVNYTAEYTSDETEREFMIRQSRLPKGKRAILW